MTVRELLERWEWKPIRNCPGRFVLVTSDKFLPLGTLVGTDGCGQHFSRDAARDTIVVVPFEDGGLISYARRNGSFVHTLNTPDGFARKLSQLGIRLDAAGNGEQSE